MSATNGKALTAATGRALSEASQSINKGTIVSNSIALTIAPLLIGGAMRSILGLVLSVSALSALAQPAPKISERALRAAFEDRLKDADSAKFRSIKHKATNAKGSWVICGEVNAKNSYGGYQGYEHFLGMVFKDGKAAAEYSILGIGEAASMTCDKEGLR